MTETMEKRFIFLGAPGAGKGTYSEAAVKEFGFVQISTGDILRENVKHKTKLGLEAKKYMEAGDLVPDDIIIGLIEDRMCKDDITKGFILDGFPRTLAQAEALDDLLERLSLKLDVVLQLEVSKETIVTRIANRIVCPQCGKSYNTVTLTPKKEGVCDDCDVELIKRPDDNAETVANRYDKYMEKTAPLIDYYEKKGLLRRMNAEGPTEKVPEVLKANIK